ncbi:terminase [Burkholderia pseudomallei MSHR338]|nr:terminase large subunit [Burkholderia mallei]EMP75756.1 terminase, large subunit [Burkholderia pseudomallei MSHR1043]EQA87859.1 terminase [Burkholderia pseudomallei MSHR338]MCS0466552.1 terminase [Burkholderia mallei]WPJ32683.1 terminase [Burkholderia mallei]WPJ38158.1 terminase [Burkholderia mallei]
MCVTPRARKSRNWNFAFSMPAFSRALSNRDRSWPFVRGYQLVRKFFPAAVALNYSPEVKTRLVLKGQSVVRNGRLQFDAGWTDLAAAFMAIKQTMTASGRQATYTAGRTDETGHADLAWACLHAIDREPLAGGGIHSSSFTEFYA